MIISLNEALTIHPRATQEMCDGLETMVRKVTNNRFQLEKFRLTHLSLEGSTIKVDKGRLDIFRKGDTVEINGTDFNDGLYVISSVSDGVLSVNGTFIPESKNGAILTKVDYPTDVIEGVKKLLAYDVKMADKIGVKSETVARWSVTYYDVTASESQEGYPAVLLGFLSKYKKIRWS
ncbi:hypothetical protein PFZ59_10985 [Streptococcus suis]|uniref:hypothetical protein n=1 Tax=Streptococcus suis TaxID=1307 RepID=UPI00240E017E|nr:hypothetical protein [Streptococcus suis]WFA75659.1 hypothetical protein PFZ59_10985 [Streptococcus suis]